jgi:hypothetical protein
VRRCLRDRTAGVALMFAVTVLPITLVFGVAIDLGFVTQSQVNLNSAADAAALAAAKTTADAFTAGKTNYVALGQVAGLQWFKSLGTTVAVTTLPTATVQVTQSGSVFVADVSYQADVTTYFAKYFGYKTIPISGLSSATITTNAYVSVTFLLDNSSSMLVAATPAGVALLGSLTPLTSTTPGRPAQLTQSTVPSGLGGYTCAFACHWDANNNDYYGLARANNVQLRFDVVKSAVQSAIHEMINEKVFENQFSVSIYTFDNVPRLIYPTSTNLPAAITAANGMQSPVVIDVANTDFPTVMNKLAAQSPAAGTGSSATSPKRALIIVTDGLADYGDRAIPNHEGPLDPANCTAVKNLGYNVYVLYTTFITSPLDTVLLNNNGLLPYITGTGATSMTVRLQSCASATANYAEASDPTAITAAMTQMLKSALGNGGRFTR